MKPVCAHEMRNGKCALTADHKGTHTTVTFWCESCCKICRGRPTETSVSGYPDDRETFYFCFPCVKENEEAERLLACDREMYLTP